MQIYLVGGAVRDELLGLLVTEKDWVVVGSSPEAMLQQNFRPVGKEFPVFLHPITQEEYALARTERKVGKGYKGFTFYAAEDVTLAEDLKRRDLTINAIAKTAEGELIDPYHGQMDLKNKILRHVSPAFQEDPVRILRVARFAARFPDFEIHADTLQLMKNMTADGEVNALVPERVWQELSRALSEKNPLRFFTTLENCGALPILFPEIKLTTKNIENFSRAVQLTDSVSIRFTTLLHELPLSEIQKLCEHYPIPNFISDLALLSAKLISQYLNLNINQAESILDFLLAVDALRRPERFLDLLFIYDICYPECHDKIREQLEKVLYVIRAINTKPLQEQGLKGEEFKEALRRLRLIAIKNFLTA